MMRVSSTLPWANIAAPTFGKWSFVRRKFMGGGETDVLIGTRKIAPIAANGGVVVSTILSNGFVPRARTIHPNTGQSIVLIPLANGHTQLEFFDLQGQTRFFMFDASGQQVSPRGASKAAIGTVKRSTVGQKGTCFDVDVQLPVGKGKPPVTFKRRITHEPDAHARFTVDSKNGHGWLFNMRGFLLGRKA